jgi:hypothetical protein
MAKVWVWVGRGAMVCEVVWFVYFMSVGLTAPALLAFFILTLVAEFCVFQQATDRSRTAREPTATRHFHNGLAFFAIAFPAAVIVGLLWTYLDYFEFAVTVVLATALACNAFGTCAAVRAAKPKRNPGSKCSLTASKNPD